MRGELVTESGEVQVYDSSQQRGGVGCFIHETLMLKI